MSFFKKKELKKRKTPEKKKESKFRLVVGVDNGKTLMSAFVFTKKEAKKELEEIRQTKGKYFISKDGNSFVEKKKIIYAYTEESD